MDINDIVTIIAEHVRDENLRREIYTKILDESDEYDIEDVEIGVDPVFDEVFEEYAPEDDDEDDFEEDEDYEEDEDGGDWSDFESNESDDE